MQACVVPCWEHCTHAHVFRCRPCTYTQGMRLNIAQQFSDATGGAAGFQNTMSALLEDVSGHRAFELGSRDELGRCLSSTSSEHHLLGESLSTSSCRRQNRWNSREALENYNNNPTQPRPGRRGWRLGLKDPATRPLSQQCLGWTATLCHSSAWGGPRR